jgi:2,4-dienoyl-CoA reductase-like NADH-dependent reductase (Old Yellow Enzyme family)
VYIDALGLGKQSHDPYKDFYEFAWLFFRNLENGNYILVTSSWLFEEFKKVIGSHDQLQALVDGLKTAGKIHITEEASDREEAKTLTQTNFADARHVVLAKKAEAMIITTQNIKDFVEFEDYLKKHCIELVTPQSF